MKMTKFAQAVAAIVCVAASSNLGQAADSEIWHLVTDTEECIPMAEVDYLLAADETLDFSVVLKNGEMVPGVERAEFRRMAYSGVRNPEERQKVSLFPTVATSALTLSGCAEGSEIRILSLQGQVLETVQSVGQETVIPVSGLAPGYYLLQTGNSTVKFIKQ